MQKTQKIPSLLSPYGGGVYGRSEGIARTGYLIPGRDGIPGLDLARNYSVAVVVVALQPWTDRHATKQT